MSLITHTDRAPIAFEPERGDETAALFVDAPENITNLLRGVAGCSPYLRGLMAREQRWLASVLDQPAKQVIRAIHGEAYENRATPGPALRRAKRRIALYVALADTGGMWGLTEVTQTLTAFADFAVQLALDHFLGAEFSRDKLPGFGTDDLATGCGLVVLAMGKMGAGELNYSSDIDLIVLFDETRITPDNFEPIRERFVRITRRMTRLLSDVTSEGYVFRTDLRLRPDPSVTPICLSMGAGERYYESLGRTWERAAFIKARPCAGDIDAGHRFIKTLRPFIWRKHLDYAAIEDAHDMRLRIREHKGLGGPLRLPGHNMKLGRGGIREIEFFTQTRQIIAGGRDPDLRVRGTLDGLAVLADKGWIGPDVARELSVAYVAHRTLEHRIQMTQDAQTHAIPASDDQIDRLAKFCGTASRSDFGDQIIRRLNRVHELTEDFFAPGTARADPLQSSSPETRALVSTWFGLPALRTSRAHTIFNRLLPVILKRAHDSVDPDTTLRRFGGFLGGLPAGIQLFSLFAANPQLIDLLVDICGTAPGLADYLSRHAAVFDGVIDGSFFDPLPDAATLTRSLARRLAAVSAYEDQLVAARRWMKERHFRVGVQHLKRMINAQEAAQGYSDLAQATIAGLLPYIEVEFARRHGPLPGRGAMVLGMGSLGARALTATSDLDLIVIYDAQGAEASIGKRPLAVSTYYGRLTQALVAALSAPMADGRLYEVDMRLRPSGRKGPVATPLSGFSTYQKTEAWTWEHLALTRARAIAGPTDLCAQIERFRCEIVKTSRDTATVLRDVRDMRARLAGASDKQIIDNIWQTKSGPGRMLDIELLAQTAALMAGNPARDVASQLGSANALGWVTDCEMRALLDSYRHLTQVRQVGRLLARGAFDPTAQGRGGTALLFAETGQADVAALAGVLGVGQRTAASVIDRVLGRDED